MTLFVPNTKGALSIGHIFAIVLPRALSAVISRSSTTYPISPTTAVARLNLFNVLSVASVAMKELYAARSLTINCRRRNCLSSGYGSTVFLQMILLTSCTSLPILSTITFVMRINVSTFTQRLNLSGMPLKQICSHEYRQS